MRDLDPTFISEKNKEENRPIFLYKIYDYDGQSNDLLFAEWHEDISFKEENYQKFPIKHKFIGENIQGSIDVLEITLCNISRLIQAYLEQYDWRGKKVLIRRVWEDQLNDPDAYMDDIFYVDQIEANQNDVKVTLSSKFDVLDIELPLERFSRTHCRYKDFKGTRCGYSGEEDSCNRTWQKCKELENYKRFGGFPSIPSRRLIIPW